MSDPQPQEQGTEGREEALPPGIDEPGSDEPEADTLEQQLLPDSGEESSLREPSQEGPMQDESPGSAFDSSDADRIEQERTVEPEEDEDGR